MFNIKVLLAPLAIGSVFTVSGVMSADGDRPQAGDMNTVEHVRRLVHEGDVDGLRNALASGFNSQSRDEVGETALMWAADRGRSEMVRTLLDAGSDVNATDNDGASVLAHAARARAYEVAKLLLASGANPAIPDHHGHTAVDVARHAAASRLTFRIPFSSSYIVLQLPKPFDRAGADDLVKLLEGREHSVAKR